eukprot:TRINITY_DN1466_c0_g1_i4.p2 TRINITY_DN1466_c0_g1~~TRINITY_DN1466_c0_g1_i4.p2  ORF type:complete len:255 (+),score=75.81 TRINITY_DN1466_c0_g1_i4:236-1000(+)
MQSYLAQWEQVASANQGSLSVGYAFPKYQTVLNASVDTRGDKKLTVDYKPTKVDGLKVKAVAKQGDVNAVILGARYRRQYFNGEVAVDVLPQDNSVHQLTAAVSAGAKGFFVGASAKANLKAQEDEDAMKLKSVDVAAAYSEGDFAVTVDTNDNLSTIRGGFFHKVSKSLQVGALIRHSRADADAPAQNDFEGSVQFTSDDGRVKKFKVSSDGTVHAAYTATVARGAVVTAVLAATTIGSNKGKAQVGLQLALA